MKHLVALVALVSMCGCAMHRIPTRAHADDKRDVPPMMLVVCILASCRDIGVPKKQETPTPSSSSRKGESTADQQASRLGPDVRREGIGPSKH